MVDDGTMRDCECCAGQSVLNGYGQSEFGYVEEKSEKDKEKEWQDWRDLSQPEDIEEPPPVYTVLR